MRFSYSVKTKVFNLGGTRASVYRGQDVERHQAVHQHCQVGHHAKVFQPRIGCRGHEGQNEFGSIGAGQ